MAQMRTDERRWRRGFTLIELLVVVAVIALLISILLPALHLARRAAQKTTAHANLRSITFAITLYGEDNADGLPMTRFSCSSRTEYELPPELADERYLPAGQKELQVAGHSARITYVEMVDIFHPDGETYRYRAPGPAIINEDLNNVFEPPNGATLWVQDDFPALSEPEGWYYVSQDGLSPDQFRPFRNFTNEPSPVRYAVWSEGPAPETMEMATDGWQLGWRPVPEHFWMKRASDDYGVITHIQQRDQTMILSP